MKILDAARAFEVLLAPFSKHNPWWSQQPRDEKGRWAKGLVSGAYSPLSKPSKDDTAPFVSQEPGNPFAPGGAFHGTQGWQNPKQAAKALGQPAVQPPGSASPNGAQQPSAPAQALALPKPVDVQHTFADAGAERDVKRPKGETSGYKPADLGVPAGQPTFHEPSVVGEPVATFANEEAAQQYAQHLGTQDGKEYAVTGADGKFHVAEKPAQTLEQPTAEQTWKPVEGWKQSGAQMGSNPGGVFTDADGNQHYVKFYANEKQAQNEALANSIYNALGISAPSSQLVEIGGKKAIASGMIPGLKAQHPHTLAQSANATKGFVADAYLANHDVVGQDFDNLLMGVGGAVRVDNGGALKFRAQGGEKKGLVDNDVPELTTMRDPGVAKKAAQVFGHLTADEMKPQAQHLVSTLTDDVIDDLVAKAGFTGEDAASYAQILKGRRDAIAAKFGIDANEPAPEEAEPAAAVPAEQPQGAIPWEKVEKTEPIFPQGEWSSAFTKFKKTGEIPETWTKNAHVVAYMAGHTWYNADRAAFAAAIVKKATGLHAYSYKHHTAKGSTCYKVFVDQSELAKAPAHAGEPLGLPHPKDGAAQDASVEAAVAGVPAGFKQMLTDEQMEHATQAFADGNAQLGKYLSAAIEADLPTATPSLPPGKKPHVSLDALSGVVPSVSSKHTWETAIHNSEMGAGAKPSSLAQIAMGPTNSAAATWAKTALGTKYGKAETADALAQALAQALGVPVKIKVNAAEAKPFSLAIDENAIPDNPKTAGTSQHVPATEANAVFGQGALDASNMNQEWIDKWRSRVEKYGESSLVKGISEGKKHAAFVALEDGFADPGIAKQAADALAQATQSKVGVAPDHTGHYRLEILGAHEHPKPEPVKVDVPEPADLGDVEVEGGAAASPAALSQGPLEGPKKALPLALAPAAKAEAEAEQAAAQPAAPAPKPKKTKSLPKGSSFSVMDLEQHTAPNLQDFSYQANPAKSAGLAVMKQIGAFNLISKPSKWGPKQTPEQMAEMKKALFSNPTALKYLLHTGEPDGFRTYKITEATKAAKLLTEALGEKFVAYKPYNGVAKVVPEHALPEGMKASKKQSYMDYYHVQHGTSAVKDPLGWKSTPVPSAPASAGDHASFAAHVSARNSLPHGLADWAPFVTDPHERKSVVNSLRAAGRDDAANLLEQHYKAAPSEQDSPWALEPVHTGASRKWSSPGLAPSKILHAALAGETNFPEGVTPTALYASTPAERQAALAQAYGDGRGWLEDYYHERDKVAGGQVAPSFAHPHFADPAKTGAVPHATTPHYAQSGIALPASFVATHGSDTAPTYAGARIPQPKTLKAGGHTYDLGHLSLPHGATWSTMAPAMAKKARVTVRALQKVHREALERGDEIPDPFGSLPDGPHGKKPAPESAHGYALTEQHYTPLLQAARASIPSREVLDQMVKQRGRSSLRAVAHTIARELWSSLGVSPEAVERLNGDIHAWTSNTQAMSQIPGHEAEVTAATEAALKGAAKLRIASNLLRGRAPSEGTLVTDTGARSREAKVRAIARHLSPDYLKAVLAHKAVTEALAERYADAEGRMPMIRGFGFTTRANVLASQAGEKGSKSISNGKTYRLREQTLSGYTFRPGAENGFAEGGRIFRRVAPAELWHSQAFSPSHNSSYENEAENFVATDAGGGHVPASTNAYEKPEGNAVLLPAKGTHPSGAYDAITQHYGPHFAGEA